VLRTKWRIAVAISACAIGVLLLLYLPQPIQRGAKSEAIKAAETTKGTTSFPSTFAQYHRLAGFPNEELDAALNCSAHSGETLSQFSVSSGQELGSSN
jgi:hypothetical protein